nr:hypothetical protein [Bacteroidota bacterium]
MEKNIKVIALGIIFSAIVFTSCNDISKTNTADNSKDNRITREEVINAQKTWGDAIVSIGEAYTNGGDYNFVAAKTVDKLYGYDEGTVLFTPTKASKKQFRLTEEEALSYFVKGTVAEDDGFALQPWGNVRFENAGMIINDDTAIAMGNYFFTDANTGEETKVEFTFGYFKDEDGNLRINVHHSSLPYNPG